MIELVYKEQTALKKVLYFTACIAIPYIAYIGWYDAAIYLLFTYIGLVFYEAGHFNIRFVIVMVAVEEMLSQVSQDCIRLVTRVLFPLEDLSGELFALYFSQGLIAFIMCLAIVKRGSLVDWYNGNTNSNMRYRLIGMEWLILLAYFFVVVLHIVFLVVAYDSIVAVSNFETYVQWYKQPETREYLTTYSNVYFLESAFLLFAVQSYNYKRCRRVWAINS